MSATEEIIAISGIRTKKGLTEIDIGTLFHCMLFAYQKAIKEILGTGSAVFVHPILHTIRRINEKQGVNLIKGKTIDEVLDNLSKILQDTALAKEFRFEKIAPKKYIFHVEGCVWAPHIHKELQPTDVTCPFALLAMSVFEKVLNGKVKVTDSIYLEKGTKTRIELL